MYGTSPTNNNPPSNIQARTIPYQGVDYASALALSQSKDVLDELFYDLCGLQRYTHGDQTFLMRISKPIFTPKYAANLMKFLAISINRITARTNYEPTKIERYMMIIADSLREELACNGFHNLISDDVWNGILQYQKTTVKITNEKGETTFISKWAEKGIIWDINTNINDGMIKIIKDELKLHNESFGQDFLLRTIYNQILIFVEGSLNRSVNALTLEHEKIVHKESIVTNNKPEMFSDESKIDKVKKSIAGWFGIR